jgi:hypothetical protein
MSAVLAKFGEAFSPQPPRKPHDSAIESREVKLCTRLVDIPHLPARFLRCRDKRAINSVSELACFFRRSNGNELFIEQQVIDDF